MNNIIECKLESTYKEIFTGLWQHDYGQILRITGVEFPKAVEIQFSLNEKSGSTITRIGTTVDGATEVQIPNELLKNDGRTYDYCIYAYIYLTDETSGSTEYEIVLCVKSRTKPENPSEEPLPEPNIFHETVVAVNASAERAETAEKNAKASEVEAGKYAASASESAGAAEKTKEDALKEVGEKKQGAIEAIQKQEETSVGKIATRTDDEIQRIQNQTADSKAELEQTITNAGVSKGEIEHSIETAGTSKTALDKSTELAGTAKTELNTSTQKAGEAKTALDGSARTAGEMQETLNATVKQAGALDTSLGEKIKTGTQLKTDLTASGEKAVQDIQTAGSEQLGKMQAVAEAFTADREQITINKEDIGSLKEDLELMQRSMLLYIEDGNIIDNYYISIRTLDINKKYAFFIIPSVDGIYTVQAGTANSTDKMIDTIASSVEILSSIGYMFYGYSPSISNINTLRLSGNVQWNLKVYEVCDSNHFLENSKRIEKNYILLSELFLTEDIILENPNYKLNKEIGTYVQTISAIATSNKIPCIPGDMIEYTLSSDGAVFVTYDNNGNVITVANSTGYSDIKTATHTFLSEEVSFRVSGSIDRYNKGLYSLKYKAGLKRFEKLENNLSIVNANIVDINDNIAENSKDIEKIKNSNINENLKPNDTYETDGCIYRCYNPYKNSGNLTLTGQLHCHTVGTGSGETQYMTPEQLCQYYKDNGYDFMTITDYSHINYYNGKPTHPITLPENFVWLCDSFEVSIPSDAKHPIKHMCLYNIQDNITISEYKSIQDMVDICKSVGGIISMAHPMYISTYYTSNMMKEVDNGLRFCEVYDGLIHSKGEERHPDDKETDFAWETLLDNGVITWGIAISDQHVANDFKNGCVKVFSDTLSRIEIMKNLCCGNFYATTNSDKKLNKISFENGEVIVETGDANAVVSFKKENGELLDTIIGEMAKYKLTGTEKYVRAIITFEDGEKIWTQPIINISNMSDNYFA